MLKITNKAYDSGFIKVSRPVARLCLVQLMLLLYRAKAEAVPDTVWRLTDLPHPGIEPRSAA